MSWLWLSLLCALALASADALLKARLSDYSARELTLVRFSWAGLLLLPLLWWYPLPSVPPAFWGLCALLVPLEISAMLIYMRAIRDYPLSHTLPYMAFTPVFVLLTGYLLLGEKVSLPGFAGILLVVTGAWILNRQQAPVFSGSLTRGFHPVALKLR
ncbi:MAG: EamA family transporter [gamma proteobacterium symbiont of Bathyaustriella thionipta]|nr:EamA family transporter [gamma proteobacterium symbiont of Bathyaustriella thionipta]